MPLIPFSLIPSVSKDDSAYASKGRVVDTSNVRWYRADSASDYQLESISGWEKMFAQPLDGLCRGIFAYKDYVPTAVLALGTHKHLYVAYDYSLYDITPYRLVAVLTNPFGTVAGSGTVTVTHVGHGAAIGDTGVFVQPAAVGGASISGPFQVASISSDGNSYTIQLPAPALSTATGGGSVTANYQLPIGLPDSLAGLGYGIGGYGSGAYSSPSVLASLKARTWSLWNWGDRLVASPSGGAVYEFQPAFLSSQLVTNGTFSADTGWTKGAGWAISGGTAVHGAPYAAAISQAVTVTAGGFYRLAFDVTAYTAGTLQPSVGGSGVGSAVSAAGHYVTTFLAAAAGNLAFTADSAFAGSISNVSLTPEIAAYQIPNAPTANLGMFVTPENFLVLLGTTDASGKWTSMTVRTSDQASNTVWAPLATNQARDTILRGGSRLVAGRPIRGQSAIWSDTSLFTMTYTGDPAFVYAYKMVATDCGLIGPNAVTVLDGIPYWMTPTGRFLRYVGVIEPIECPFQEDIFTNLAPVQQEKIFASVLTFPGGVRIKWEIPDGRDGVECSRYAEYDPASGIWSTGPLARTAAVSAGALPLPVAVGPDGTVFWQEKGSYADGGPLSWSFKTAPMEIGNGDTLMAITRMIGDWKTLQGAATVTLYGRNWPADGDQVVGPLPITAGDLHTDFVMTARQVAVEFKGQGAPSKMRIGRIRFQVEDTGMTL
ncbi:MAG: hypothetical protein F8N37_12045 [Telmatospirillum sp.]|nr:hypothetical protein [Telmatospirillum sp.]